MSDRDSLSTRPSPTFGDGGIRRNASPLHSPTQNHILAALPAQDYQRLLPDLEPVALAAGHAIYRAGDSQRRLYFLTEGLVSRQYVTQTGVTTEFAITGVEGVIGIASFLGGDHSPGQAVALEPGYAYVLDAARVMDEFDRGGALRQLLLRYTLALMTQTAQIAVCNRQHSVEQRLCRWLLSCLDRLQSNRLRVTHELMADALGSRRPSVTQALGVLEDAGLIQCSRGHVTVAERRRLELHACECYGVVRHAYGGLFTAYRCAA